MRDPLHEALQTLPHGPEFRFVDRLLELAPGVEARGEYTVRGDEAFLRAHFPGEPLFPGVLLVEAAAQLAGIVAQSSREHAALPNLRLAALQHVKILGTARPGETVTLRAKVTGRLGGLVQAEAEARIGGKQVLVAALTLSGDAA